MWFRNKKDESSDSKRFIAAVLDGDPRMFVEFVQQLICESEPGCATMCTAALKVLDPIALVMMKLAKEKPNEELPGDRRSIVLWRIWRRIWRHDTDSLLPILLSGNWYSLTGFESDDAIEHG